MWTVTDGDLASGSSVDLVFNVYDPISGIARLGDNEVVCTPTLMSKGFLKPDDLCIVDMEGNQLSGRRKDDKTPSFW